MKYICRIILVLVLVIINAGIIMAQETMQKTENSEPADAEIRQMLAAMLMLGFRGYELSSDDILQKLMEDGMSCNIILFDKDVASNAERNIKSAEQLRLLTANLRKAAKAPILIAVDQEGGQVRRLKPSKGFMDLPSAQSMGQKAVAETFAKASALGQELASLGINTDLAPVVDVDTNPYNPVIGRLGRAFGTDPAIVSAHALAFGQGLAKNGVIPVLKHFPGQGCAEKDSHQEATDISQCWNADIDLLPYAEIFNAGWPGMVMAGHLILKDLDSAAPASLSANIITGLLRQGLKWQGVVITDDLEMKSASQNEPVKTVMLKAINAGADILLFGNNLEWNPDLPRIVWNAILELYNEKKLSKERVMESWRRISAIHKAYNLQ